PSSRVRYFLAGVALAMAWQQSPFGKGAPHVCRTPVTWVNDEVGFVVGPVVMIELEAICPMTEDCSFNRHDPDCPSVAWSREK
ncbi:MAG: hypothetical protein GY711_24495, partial [bacterium]|nr:hypothetical protein [bacterium]